MKVQSRKVQELQRKRKATKSKRKSLQYNYGQNGKEQKRKLLELGILLELQRKQKRT
jgi:hypothetical protein